MEKPTFRGAERLRRSVSELPLRYAPFYARLAQLWGLPEERVEAELSRAADAANWSRTPLRGVTTFAVEAGAAPGSSRVRLLRLAPGARFPSHRHLGSESVLVLEGSYTDSTGTHVGAGDQQHMAPGTEHELRVQSNVPCIAAVIEHGIEFDTAWLRWLSKLFGARG